MKKLFFYAAAALAMLASCQKAEISGTVSEIDDSKPAAIKFGVDAPSLITAKTRAAVDSWSDNTVYVYGFKQERDEDKVLVDKGTGMYDFANILINNYETVAGEGTLSTLDVYDKAYPGQKIPYYYAEGQTYDFYGYHLGGALIQGDPTMTANSDKISYEITFEGNNDVMVAKTDRAADIAKKTTDSGVTESDLYSSWAARRGVQPTLKFEHALTRFNFIIKGKGEKYKNVRIDEISMESVNTGTLTVVGDDLGFVPSTTVQATTLKLKNADDTDYTPENVLENASNVPAGKGSSLMVAPGMTDVDITVKMTNIEHLDAEGNGTEVTIPAYEFNVAANKVTTVDGSPITTFAAGAQYNIYINVYGPEAIEIEAELTAWENGGSFEYDPDAENRPGTPVAASLTVKKSLVSASTAVFTVEYDPSVVDEIQGAVTDSQETPAADSPAWEDVPMTRATSQVRIAKDGLEEGKTYYCHVRYKEVGAAPEDEYESVTVSAVPVKPEFDINGFICVDDEAAFNTLPESYLAGHKYDPATTDLPWLAVWFTKLPEGETVKVKLTKNGNPVDLSACADWSTESSWDSETNEFIYVANKDFSLFTFNQAELGDALESGEWNVTLTYGDQIISKDLVVALESEFTVDSFVCVVTEEDFNNKLPEFYTTQYPYNSETTGLPWLAVTFTKCPVGDTVKVVLKKNGEVVSLENCESWGKWSDKTKALSVTAEKKPFSLFTFNNTELGGVLDAAKLAEDNWTVELTYGKTTVTKALEL